MAFEAGVSASMTYASYLIKVGLISLGALGVTGILRKKGGLYGFGGYGADYESGYGGYDDHRYGGYGGYDDHRYGGYGGYDDHRYGGYGYDRNSYGRYGGLDTYEEWHDSYRKDDRYRDKSPEKKSKIKVPPDDPYASDDAYYEQYYKNYYDNYYKKYWDEYYKDVDSSQAKTEGPDKKRKKRNLLMTQQSSNVGSKESVTSKNKQLYALFDLLDVRNKHGCGVQLFCKLAAVHDRLLTREEFAAYNVLRTGLVMATAKSRDSKSPSGKGPPLDSLEVNSVVECDQNTSLCSFSNTQMLAMFKDVGLTLI